jgi:hypothetical protein
LNVEHPHIKVGFADHFAGAQVGVIVADRIVTSCRSYPEIEKPKSK